MPKLKETKNTYSIFRIHRTKDIKPIGLGPFGDYYETKVFYNYMKKNGLKCAITSKAYLAATHFREVNKGYPRGFFSYRTFNEIEQERRFGATREDRDKKKHSSEVIL